MNETNRRYEITKMTYGGTGDGLHITMYATIDGVEYATLAYGLGANTKLAHRLGIAFVAKAFYKTLTVRTDAIGGKYATTVNFNDFSPSGRTLNADLKRLGF